MDTFTISANRYLNQDIVAFNHTNFGGVSLPNNPNFLYKFKNDPHHNWTDDHLRQAQRQLFYILLDDLPEIHDRTGISPFTVCVVPRSKSDQSYNANQLLFKATVATAVNRLDNNFFDGTDFIVRHTNTKTTHLRKPMDNFINDGSEPYVGISSDTCNFSPQIRGKHILLIDDIYTLTVNIDEDMIQAILDRGARSVTFYAIGKTIRH